MNNLVETPGWSDIPQIETTDELRGGQGGVLNAQAQAIANRFGMLESAAGAAKIGFAFDGAGAVPRTVDKKLSDSVSVRDFGVVGDGVADDTAAMQFAFDYLATPNCSHLEATGLTIRLTGPVWLRASQKIIEGKRAKIILASSTAGFRIAGQANKITGFKFSQASQADTPTAIYVYNDAITNNSCYTVVEECEGANVYRGLHFYMAITGAGAAAYRQTVRGCRFVNTYLPKAWPGGFGIAFDGANPGDSAGNDSHVLHSYVKGYESNYVVHNSVATAFVQCSGDGAGAGGCFKYSGNSSGLRLIGGYYEYNDTLIFCANGVKYDAYFLYPSVANTVNAQITGDGIAFVSGGWSIGTANQTDIKNGAYKTTTGGIAEIWAANGVEIYSHKDKLLRASVNNAGAWSIPGTVAMQSALSVNEIKGYTGGSTPLKIVLTSTSTATRLVFGTNSTERVEINYDGNLRPATDNAISFGEAARRWTTMYAATGTVNTSDERSKQQIQSIDTAALRAWGKVEFCQYKFNDAVEEKGEGARWHFGVIAQRVKEAFESEGLDPFAYGVLCFDEWDELPELIESWEDEYDDRDNLVRPAGSEVVQHYRAAGSRYGIRYEEALALECAYLRSCLK